MSGLVVMRQPGFDFGFRILPMPAVDARHERRRRLLRRIDAAERRLWLHQTGHDLAYLRGWIVPGWRGR